MLLVAGDHEAKKIICAWQFCPIRTRRQLPDLEGKSDAEAWDALWRCVRFDLADLAARAGLPPGIVRQKFEMIRSARLILPDGSISKTAKLFFRIELGKRYGRTK